MLLANSMLQAGEPEKNDDHKTISVNDLSELKIIGKLGIPLGKLVEMRATIIEGEGKMDSTRYFLKVTSIAGNPLKEPVVIRFCSFPRSPFPTNCFELYEQKKKQKAGNITQEVRKALEKDYIGTEVQFLGFESGAFMGLPEGVPHPGTWQSPDFHFISELMIFSEI